MDPSAFYLGLENSTSPGAYTFSAISAAQTTAQLAGLLYYDATKQHTLPIFMERGHGRLYPGDPHADRRRRRQPHHLALRSRCRPKVRRDPPTWDFPLKTTPAFAFDSLAYVAIFMIANGFAFPPGGFAVDVVKDRQLEGDNDFVLVMADYAQIKHQLEIMGALRRTYWVALFCRSLVTFSITGVLVVVLIAAFQISTLTGLALLPVTILIALYMPVIILTSFVLSFMFDNYEIAQSYAGSEHLFAHAF